METSKINISKRACLAFIAVLMININSITAQEELAPDQNPNYKKSQEKYMSLKDELTKNEGTTVQATYKAIDDMQIKQERKDLRKSNRQDRRMARINNRGYYNNSPYYYNNSMYYNNSLSPYNYGCNNFNSYQNYYPFYNNYNYNRQSCGLNRLGNTALFGLGAYLWLR